MPTRGPMAATHLVPLMRYRDVGVASEWLCATFGFEPHFAAKAPDGAVFYAELKAGSSMVMLGAAGEPGLETVMRQSGEAPDDRTQSCYVVVADVAGHYEHAKEAGAPIVLDLKTEHSGGAGYSCRDPEGHVWNFGTYDPWTAQSNAPRRKGKGVRRSFGAGAVMALTLTASIVSGWYLYGHGLGGPEALNVQQRLREAILGAGRASPDGGLATGTIGPANDEAMRDARAAVTRAERTMSALKDDLERERQAKAAAERAAAKARADADKAVAGLAKTPAERTTTRASPPANGDVAALRSELDEVRAAAAKHSTEIAALKAELKSEQDNRAAAERAVAAAEAATGEERAAKEAVQRALVDTGVRISTLERDLEAAKSRANSLSRARAAAARPKPRPKTQQNEWPFSQW